jgi:hypothetical protein
MLQQRAGFSRQYSTHDAGMVIESGLRERIDDAPASAGLGILRTVYEAGDASMHDRARAHHARLERHIELTPAQTVVCETSGGLAQGGDFSVRRRVTSRNGVVIAAADDFAVFDHHRPDGHFACRPRLRGELERGAHEPFLQRPLRHIICIHGSVASRV